MDEYDQSSLYKILKVLVCACVYVCVCTNTHARAYILFSVPIARAMDVVPLWNTDVSSIRP